MPRIVLLSVLAALFAATAAGAATHVVEALPNNTFSPSSLTIAAGDTVTWRNTGGLHNVRADDGSFRCANGCDGSGTGNGSPSSSAWEFSLTFNDPGTISYDCEVHASLGMVGTITVEPSTAMPGLVNFTASSYDADEGDGSARIRVERHGGSDGMVTVDADTSSGSADSGVDFIDFSGVLTWGNGETGVKFFDIPLIDDDVEESPETINLRLSAPTGGVVLANPSAATLNLTDNDAPPPPPPPPPPPSVDCMADEFTLCLNRDDRFKVQVDWATATDSGQGRAKDIGVRDSGLFYFFGENNIEMLVKVLDGCRITDHFWVFYAATTNVEFTLTVVDTEANVTKRYKNKLGNPANAVTDTSAFATCP